VHFKLSPRVFTLVQPYLTSTIMTESEYIELARQKNQELQALKSKPTFYDYEKSFVDIWQDLGRQVLEKSLSNVPNDRRKKKGWVAAMG